MKRNFLSNPIVTAVTAAALFGASTPAAKTLLGQVQPTMLAGLLYLGSGIGLSLYALLARRRPAELREAKLKLSEMGWLAGAVFAGGVVAPVALLIGLTSTSAAAGSLLLNLEAVLTAAFAWFVFKENFDRRIAAGMVAIVAGSVVLSVTGGGFHVSLAALGIVLACLCWAVDNNLTRKISLSDPFAIARIKGLVAGTVNCSLAFALGNHLPSLAVVAVAGTLGFLSYGVSLALFVLALRNLGTARTGAYFSTAPFIGAVLAIAFLHEPITANVALAAVLMAVGVWLHATEKHEHEHAHEEMEHEHSHVHDAHHQHAHQPGQQPPADGSAHTHMHKHAPLVHSHPHYPDQHHQHVH